MLAPMWAGAERVGFAGLCALALTMATTPVVRRAALRWGWIAKPVQDRWGRRVIARLGGVSIFAGVTLSALVWIPPHSQILSLLLGIVLVFALGLADDMRRMPPYTKLVGQLLIGCLVVLSGIRIDLISSPWLAVPLSVLWFVLVMNAFNLLDNMDGLAAGIGAIGSGFCAVHAVLAGNWSVATAAAILAGSCLGFLRYNFPPAKIFMGDSGSHLLGLVLAALALMGSWRHSTQLLSVLLVPALVLAVPIFDTCFVTIQRLAHGQHPFVGGTDHVSHRLAILGLSTRQTVLVLYSVSTALGLLSLASVDVKPLSALALWLSTLTGLVLCGGYLAKVSVYRLERPGADTAPSETGAAPSTFIDTMLMHKRRLAEVLVDFCLISSVYVFAHLLRFEALTQDLHQQIVRTLPILLVIKLTCFGICGLYRGVWRYLGLADIVTVFKSVTLGSICSLLALVYLWRFEGYSRSVLIIDWMLTFLAVGGSRVAERLLDEWIKGASQQAVPIVIIGAGDTGARVLRLLKEQGQIGRRVIGFLDDDLRKHGTRIQGARVVGGRSRLPDIIREARVQEVLIAMTDPPGELLQYIQRCCAPSGVKWKVVTAGIRDAV